MNTDLERILNSDSNCVHEEVDTKINTLDHLHSVLTQKSDFINSFQRLLNQQLSTIAKPTTSSKLTSVCSSCNKLKQNLTDFKHYLTDSIEKIQSNLKSQFINCMNHVVQQMTRNYESKIATLQARISQLQQTKQSFLSIPINDDHDQAYPTWRSDDDLDNHSILVGKGEKKWKSYVCELSSAQVKLKHHQEKQNTFSDEKQPKVPYLLKNYQKAQKYQLPSLKISVVSNPPLEDGFSIMKMNSQIVYKGNWKNRKFHGKGKLTLPQYTYDGSFLCGLFDGRGILKVGKYEYVGQFKSHKANGNGVLKVGGQTISGRWEDNLLIERYC